MRYDRHLFEATRTRVTWLAIGFFVALVGVASVDSCGFLLNFLNKENPCSAIVIARQNVSSEVLGINVPNQVGAISGAIGFVLATSGTRSKKWLGVGIALGLFFLYIVWRTVWPS